MDVPVKDGRSIDEILASIMDGNEDHREIFETLKSVARETSESGAALAAPKPASAATTAQELGERFLCPVCETLVAADATTCPGCGAEFSEGATAEYGCPVCKGSVRADARECPSGGARVVEDKGVGRALGSSFGMAPREPDLAASRRPAAATAAGTSPAGKQSRSPLLSKLDRLREAGREPARRIPSGDRKLLYRELPKLVNEVKPLLVSAKRIGLEIEEAKRIINEAIQAGKGRDIERAVALIAEARRALDSAFVEYLGNGIERFVREMRAARGEPGVEAVTPILLQAVARMEAGNYDSAWDAYQDALTRFESEAKDFHDARKAIESGDRLLREVRAMGMDIQGVERLLRQARDTLDRRDASSAHRIANQVRDRLNREVPVFVQEEMRKARSRLLDLKLEGNDLATPIGILKDASTSVKAEAWADALRKIREFYRVIERTR